MSKTDAIARRILGWKLNRVDRWYDYESETFIDEADFQPTQNLDHAMLIVEKLQLAGFTYTYTQKKHIEVCFNEHCATGKTLAEAITNTAYLIADNSSIDDAWF